MTYCRKNCPLHFSTLPWNLRFLPYSPDEIKVVSPVAGNLRIGSKRNSVPTVDPVDQRIKIAKKRRNLLKMKQACSESKWLSFYVDSKRKIFDTPSYSRNTRSIKLKMARIFLLHKKLLCFCMKLKNDFLLLQNLLYSFLPDSPE